jgi:hypothetical protein
MRSLVGCHSRGILFQSIPTRQDQLKKDAFMIFSVRIGTTSAKFSLPDGATFCLGLQASATIS